MCVWSRWTEKIKTAWSLFISHAWLTPPHRFTKIIISILTPLLKAEPGHWPILVHISQSFWTVKDSLFMVDLERKKKRPYFCLCVYLSAEPTRLNFVRYGRGVTSQGKIPFWCCVLEICKDYYRGFGYKLHIKDEWTTGLGRGLLWPHNAIINPE